jgi:hypothetical protein
VSRARAPFRWVWGVLAAVALLWPARLTGPLDGIPLDGRAEAILVGVVFPALWWFHPTFLTSKFARACIIALLGWNAFCAATLVQDGWCVRFSPARPYINDQTGPPHAWDVRADWRAPNPTCSAIVTRSYRRFGQFPAWFFNLPPPNESWPDSLDLPPEATVGMVVQGFLHIRQPGVFEVATGLDSVPGVWADGKLLWRDRSAYEDARLAPGPHWISVDATMKGSRWQLIPSLNGEDVWRQAIATVKNPSRLDLIVRPWGNGVGTALSGLLIVGWLGSAGLLLRAPNRLRNIRGAFCLFGVPWLALVVAANASTIGVFRLYAWGHDYWMYQRFAYTIVMRGHWLEGGTATFWFQPLYRWIVGLLHLIFGDSSVGEAFWDGACMLTSALFSFHVVRRFAGFWWGVASGVVTLAVFTLGTWQFVGLGLSEISSAGFIYLAALFALRSRTGRIRSALAAGVLATLGFYTRLNNFPMAVGVGFLALPISLPAGTLFRPREWFPRVAWRTVAVVEGTLLIGVLLLAWRNWYYNGVFSPWYGTQVKLLSVWQPGAPMALTLQRVAGSVMMVLTMNDPAKFAWYALPLLLGVIVSVLAIAGVPRLRELPFGPGLFCLASISGSLVARGSAYPGRFSIHAIAIGAAVTVCGIATIVRKRPHYPRTRSNRHAAR